MVCEGVLNGVVVEWEMMSDAAMVVDVRGVSG